jgi:hypothetical protein
MARWLLVFEDPMSETLWLGKATPRKWLEDSKKISVSRAPTRWGRISYSAVSHLSQNSVSATIVFPTHFGAVTKLRLRMPGNRTLKAVQVNGRPWSQFDPAQETITIPAGASGTFTITAEYETAS